MRREKWIALALVIAVVVAGGAVLMSAVRARARSAELSREPVVEVRVPHRKGELTVDGEFEDEAWRTHAGTGAFVGEDGAPLHPHSEARFTWDEESLYVLLYAADENIQAKRLNTDDRVWEDDSFHLLFNDGTTEYALDVSARGVVADGRRRVGAVNADGSRPFDYVWASRARISSDVDGTYDDPSDDDEEWVLEMAIPLDSLGVSGDPNDRLAFMLRRCDTPKNSPRVCGTFPGRGKRGMLRFEEAKE
jgi:hypothetical protein